MNTHSILVIVFVIEVVLVITSVAGWYLYYKYQNKFSEAEFAIERMHDVIRNHHEVILAIRSTLANPKNTDYDKVVKIKAHLPKPQKA